MTTDEQFVMVLLGAIVMARRAAETIEAASGARCDQTISGLAGAMAYRRGNCALNPITHGIDLRA